MDAVNSRPAPVRVLVADDADAMRQTLAEVIDGDASLELVALARDADEAIELAMWHRPDIALIDVRMPRGGGPRAVREIRRVSPRTRIVAISAHGDEHSIEEMLAGGATSYLMKEESVETILDGIWRTLEGKAALSGPVAAHVLTQLRTRLGREGEESARRQNKEARIRRLLESGEEPSIVFQPIAALGSGEVVGLEALSRFTSEPVRGPDLWFAEGAAVGLGMELEMAAARRALGALERLPPDVYLSINMGPEALVSPRFDEALRGVPTDRVVVEITEHAPTTDYPRLKQELRYLRGLGVRIAVDDAGAGFASFRHILELRPDIIKLDTSITRDVHAEVPKQALVSALVAFASKLGAELVAEGVETAEEAVELGALGVQFVQGFHIARPGPIPDRFTIPELEMPSNPPARR